MWGHLSPRQGSRSRRVRQRQSIQQVRPPPASQLCSWFGVPHVSTINLCQTSFWNAVVGWLPLVGWVVACADRSMSWYRLLHNFTSTPPPSCTTANTRNRRGHTVGKWIYTLAMNVSDTAEHGLRLLAMELADGTLHRTRAALPHAVFPPTAAACDYALATDGGWDAYVTGVVGTHLRSLLVNMLDMNMPGIPPPPPPKVIRSNRCPRALLWPRYLCGHVPRFGSLRRHSILTEPLPPYALKGDSRCDFGRGGVGWRRCGTDEHDRRRQCAVGWAERWCCRHISHHEHY